VATDLRVGECLPRTGRLAQLALAECPPAVSQDAASLFTQLETLDET